MTRKLLTGIDNDGQSIEVVESRNKWKRWGIPVYAEGEEEPSYPDERVCERILTGRLTKARYKIIERYARKHRRSQSDIYGEGFRCGHEHDCCGCLVGEWMSTKYTRHWKGTKVVLRFSQSFNY